MSNLLLPTTGIYTQQQLVDGFVIISTNGSSSELSPATGIFFNGSPEDFEFDGQVSPLQLTPNWLSDPVELFATEVAPGICRVTIEAPIHGGNMFKLGIRPKNAGALNATIFCVGYGDANNRISVHAFKVPSVKIFSPSFMDNGAVQLEYAPLSFFEDPALAQGQLAANNLSEYPGVNNSPAFADPYMPASVRAFSMPSALINSQIVSMIESISAWDMRKIEYLDCVFMNHIGAPVNKPNVAASWELSSLKSMVSGFFGAQLLKFQPLSWDTSKLTITPYNGLMNLFNGSHAMASDLSQFDFSNIPRPIGVMDNVWTHDIILPPNW